MTYDRGLTQERPVADESDEQLALAGRLSRLVISGLDSHEFSRRTLAELAQFVPVDWATLAFIQRQSESVLVSPLVPDSAAQGLAPDLVVPLGNTAFAWVAENRRALLESQPDQSRLAPGLKDEDWLPEDLGGRSVFPANSRSCQAMSPSSYGIRSLVHMPLFSRGEVFGVSSIGSRQPAAYPERTLKLVKYTAVQLAIGLDNRRLFERSHEQASQQAGLLSMLNHEIRTSLTPLVSSSALLRDQLGGRRDSPESKLTESISQAAQAMKGRLSKLLDLLEISAPNCQLQLEPLAAEPWLKDIGQAALSMARNQGQKLAVELPDALPLVRADAGRLRQALLILLENAIQRSSERGMVRLRASQADAGLVIVVQDQGPLFSAEERERLVGGNHHLRQFDRESLPQLVLDLTIVRRIVELHSGRFWIDGDSGKGNNYGLSLPMAGKPCDAPPFLMQN